MGAFAKISESYSGVNFNKIFQKIFSKEKIEKYIVENIAKDLYNSGITGDGKILQTDTAKRQGLGLPYSKFTTKLKADKNHPTNRVTLYDTGEFDYSMNVYAGNLYAEVKADFQKDNGNIYDNFKYLFKSYSDFQSSVLTLRKKKFDTLLDSYILIEFQKELINFHSNV